MTNPTDILLTNIGDDFKKTAKELCQYLDFDTWQIIMLNKDRLYGIVLACSDILQYSPIKINQRIYNLNAEPNCLNLVFNNKKTFYYQYHDAQIHKLKPLTTNALTELCYPLMSTRTPSNQIIGLLYLSKKDFLPPSVKEKALSENVVNQIISLQKTLEIAHLEYMGHRRLFNIFHMLSEIIKTREPYMERHPYNVAYLSNIIGKEIGLSNLKLHRLYIASILHDIGKLYIPETILNKNEALNKEEMELIKLHPIHGYQMLQDLAFGFTELSGVEKIVLQHHERYDGTGYPHGLKGEEILIESRILAIADAIDAMISNRGYKKPKSLGAIINDLMENQNKQFDPHLAQVMIDILTKQQDNKNILLKEPILIGTLEILAKEKSCQLRGTLIKTEFAYKFKIDYNECYGCTFENCQSKLADIIQATFYTENNDAINEFTATIFHKEKEKIYISRLIPKMPQNCFSLTWILDGLLTFKNATNLPITIKRIGGNFLDFYLYEDDLSNQCILEDIHTLTINFEKMNIVISGKITKQLKIDQRMFFTFTYINILEGTRDKIFGQIFKKQVAYRKNLFYSST